MKDFIEFCINALKKGGWAPIIVFAIHAVLSRGFSAYAHFPLLDIPMHFIGGIVICYFFWAASKTPNSEIYLGQHTHFSLFVMLMALTAFATIMWEFAEWTRDALTGKTDAMAQVSISDTMADMLLGLVGGAVIALRAAIKHN